MTVSGTTACIVGVGNTPYRKWGGFGDRTEFDLACEAVRSAANDAGLPAEKIDGFASFANDFNEGHLLQLGVGTGELKFSGAQWGGGGAGACGAVAMATMAVETGAADYVVVLRALSQGQRGRFGQFRPGLPFGNFKSPFGLFGPPQMLGMLASRFMHEYGVTERHLAKIVLNAREKASRNPDAVFRDKPPIGIEDYLASRWISEPFRLFDCTLETDGACALIVTSLERARDLRQKPVRILASGQGSHPGWGAGATGTHTQPHELYTTGNHDELARRLYARAGVGPDDIRIAQVYDNFSAMPLFAFEDYGFCGRGQSAGFLDAGSIEGTSPRLALNTSGGHLAEGYMHGLNHVLEGARQIRGTSTSQAADHSLCLVVSSLAIAPSSAVILGEA